MDREIIGACSPHLIDRRAVRYGFDQPVTASPAENYLHWVRGVAEVRWASEPITELPWWVGSTDEDEIADPVRHADARMFNGPELAEERLDLTLLRAEFAALAIGRYQAQICDVAALLGKHPNSITRWLNQGLQLEREDPAFKRRIDTLDEAASRPD